MALAVYPNVPIPSQGVELEWDDGVIVARQWVGGDVRTAPWPLPALSLTLDYEYLIDDPGEAERLSLIQGFIFSRRGRYEEFLFSPFYLNPDGLHLVENQLLGMGDGATTEFPVIRDCEGYQEAIEYLDPTELIGFGQGGFGKNGFGGAGGSASGREPPYVYLDGNYQDRGYTISGGLLIFTTPPAAGVQVAMSYNFFYQMRLDSNLKGRWVKKNLWRLEKVKLIQV